MTRIHPAQWHVPKFNGVPETEINMQWKTTSDISRNMVSKKPYRGFNFWYLLSFGFERPYFLAFKQVQDLGGRIKKGSSSFMIVFWKTIRWALRRQ